MNPKVTVLMSVYNGEKYLGEAIGSILSQTYKDFEFIIINDASTDSSKEIINSFSDSRIKIIENPRNLGLTASLNIGLEQACGQYIARMDCDDISLPQRLEKQAAWLDANPGCAVVAAKTVMINGDGKLIDQWEDDICTITYREIRTQLPRSNCLAHPSVMLRASVVRQYQYNPSLKNSQDYDLWLRLCSDGLVIEKIDEELIKYRVHGMSITSVSNRLSSELKIIKAKCCFLKSRVAEFQFNCFVFKVFVFLMQDILIFGFRRVKGFSINMVKTVLINIGKVLGSFLPRFDSSLYFFFSDYHIGGAEKVHADIVACVADQNPIVFFTNKSINQKFKFLFQGKGKLFDISKLTENRIFSLICLGIFAKIINKHPYPVVFGSNSAFYYRLIPYLHSSVYKIDLIHAFGGGVEIASLQVVSHLDARVVINTKTLQDIIEQYASNGIDSKLSNRALLIENQTIVPDRYPKKHEGGPLRIIYIGRGTEEKRVHLIGRAAAECYQRGVSATFTFVGDVYGSVEFDCREFCLFTGEIWEPDQLNDVYRNADILVLTSSREGFPMVIMEAMAHGVVPVTTTVGGIPDHVQHGLNGMLISGKSENDVVDSLVAVIDNLDKNRKLLRELSYSAYKYANENFKPSRFHAVYRKLLLKQPHSQKGDKIHVI